MSAGRVVETPTVGETLIACAPCSCEPPYAAGVGAEQPLALACRRAERDRMGRRDPERKRRRQRADRPIAAPDHPVPAKALDRVLDIGANVVNGPSFRIGI